MAASSDAAAELVQETEARLAAVDEAIAGADQPTAAQLYVEGKSISAIGAGVEHDIIRRAGGDNLFSPDEKLFDDFFAATITPEEVAARNPDAIVFSVSDDVHEQQVRDYLRSTFPDVTAVAEDRLVAIPAADLPRRTGQRHRSGDHRSRAQSGAVLAVMTRHVGRDPATTRSDL